MTAFLYETYLEGLQEGEFSWVDNDIVIAVVSDQYTPSSSLHTTRADIGAAEMASSGPLQNKAGTEGKAISDGITVSNVGDGATIANAIVMLAKVDATPANDRLVFYTDQITGWPWTPDNNDISFQPPNTDGAWFKL